MANVRIALRRGTAIEWATSNTVLLNGEPGYETNTGNLKIGDGRTPWNDLEYFTGAPLPGGASDAAVFEHINSETPHPVYDDGPSLLLLYQNAKV